MSDRPEMSAEEQPEMRGSWHAPRTPSLWRPVEEDPAPPAAGWVVPALPRELEAEPAAPGGWHLPAPEDTPYEEDDEIEVREDDDIVPPPEDFIALMASERPASRSQALRPEDMIAQLRGTSPSAEAVEEETPLPTTEEEEFRSLLEGDELATLNALGEADDESFSISEYMTLASLELEEDDASFAALDEADDGLSPAERALYATAGMDPGDLSAADVAAQMAARLAGEGSAEGAVVAGEGESAADVAARMARQLAQGDTSTLSGTQPLSPAEMELARKFRETRQRVQVMRSMYRNGQISYDELQNRLREQTILDDQQRWWMIGVETDKWYVYDNAGQQWQEAEPPVSLTVTSPRTETGQLDPNEVLAGSLPYLPQDTGGEYSNDPYATRITDASPAYDPYGQSGTPVPRPGQPQVDPNVTMVGNAFNVDYLSGSEPTLAGVRMVDATVPSMATVPSAGEIDYNPRIESAVDYDIQGRPGSTYDEYRQRERASAGRMIVLGLVALLACGLLSAIAAIGGITVWYNQQVEPYRAAIAGLANYEPEFKTARILDANGDLIAELTSPDGGARDEIPLEQMSPYLVHAVLSAENRTFYEDPGFAIDRIIGAFIQNLRAGQIESGASTITQQVARQLILGDTDTTADRKIREILVAMELARNYDKNFILQLYLNEVSFGNQSFGVEAASRFYFSKPAAQLNMAEAALLTSLIQSPAGNDPIVNREQSKRAMREVIRRMIDVGCLQFQFGEWAQTAQPFCINDDSRVLFNGQQVRLYSVNSDGTYGGLLAVQLAQVETRQYRPRQFGVRYPHFVNYILAQLEAQYGQNTLYQRGFTVYTTIIPRIQDEAETSLRAQVAGLVNNGVNTGAVMVTDPTTGAIRAMVGSPDFSNNDIDGQVDNTRTFQQPGSAIKPVLYAAALEGGPRGYLTPASILWDVPSQYGNYVPTNFRRGVFSGPVPMRDALQNSLNIPAVKAYEFVGTEKFVEMAGRMQLTYVDGSQFGLPSALGANDVRLIDMMKAYGIIANNGQYAPLYAIDRITEDVDGQALEVPREARPAPTRAIAPQIAYILQNILSDDPARGREFGVNSNLTLVRLGVPNQGFVAAKTGTSNDGRDLWSMGFTHNTVVGVWLGTYDNAPTVGVTGFTAAAPIWNRVLVAAISGRPPQPFQNPGGVVQVTVCRETGTLAGDTCPTRVTDIAMQAQMPASPDQGFVRTAAVDSWTGLVANEWCPENVVQAVVANINDPFAIQWINNTNEGRAYAQRIGLPLPLAAAPTTACQQGQQLPNVRLNTPASGETLSEIFTITGQVAGPNFNRYELEYAPADRPDFFSPIGAASNQQLINPGSPLGSWDTRTVPNGQYIVRLAAYSNTGGNILRQVNVVVQNVLPTATPTPLPQPTFPPAAEFTPIPFDTPSNVIPFDPAGPATPTATLAF